MQRDSNTVKIPPQHMEAFYMEAVTTLAFAADNLEEGASWWKHDDEKPKTINRGFNSGLNRRTSRVFTMRCRYGSERATA